MDESLPPPPHAGYEAWADRVSPGTDPNIAPRRPGVITAAGILLLVSAGFSLLGALILLSSGARPTLTGLGSARAFAAVLVVVGGLHLLAGVLVLARMNGGRILAIVLASLGVLGALSQLRSATGFVSLAINGFVVYTLATNGDAFRRRTRR
ncbi:MAG: hypothetical protein WBM72_10760 [Actinomycetota bacterium]